KSYAGCDQVPCPKTYVTDRLVVCLLGGRSGDGTRHPHPPTPHLGDAGHVAPLCSQHSFGWSSLATHTRPFVIAWVCGGGRLWDEGGVDPGRGTAHCCRQ